MSENIFISIIIPNYNKGPFIIETLNSLKNQTYKFWEAIIIDDCSTDDSFEIIKKFQLKCENIKIISSSKKHKGASACRNIGIKKSIGKYIMFLDSDDLVTPDCLTSRLKIFSTYPDYDFIVFPTGTFFNKIGDNAYIWSPTSKNFLVSFLKHDVKWTISSPLWKKSALNKLNGFDEDYTRLQDVELHTRALLNPTFRFKVFPDYIADNFYRINEKRKVENTEKQLEIIIAGHFTYIAKISSILNVESHKNAIKVSLFVLMNQINYASVKNKISAEVLENFEKTIKSFIYENSNIFKTSDWFYFKIYNIIYRLGFWRIKGYNFIMKTIFSII